MICCVICTLLLIIALMNLSITPGDSSTIRPALHNRKSWSFLEEFIIHGGLGVIASMTGDANLYYRGQAFEILLSITDNDSFDWFHPHDGSTKQKILHERLLGLSKNPNFLPGLIENRKNSYPGGSFQALQIMGFWLSWVRALKTKDQVLNLSDKIIHELYLWSEGDGEKFIEEEMALAKAIFQDFSYDQFHKDQPSGSGSIDMGKFFAKASKSCSPTSDNEICDDSEFNKEKDEENSANGFSREEQSLLYVSGFQSPEKGVELPTLPSAVEIAKIFLARKPAQTSVSHNFETADNYGANKSTDRNGGIDSKTTVFGTNPSFNDVSHHNSFSPNEASSSPLVKEFVAEFSLENFPESTDEDSLSKAQATKTKGNELFKISKYNEALIVYKESLLLLESLDTKIYRADKVERLIVNEKTKSFMNDVKILKVSLHFNCATVHWKLSEFRNNSNNNNNSSSSSNMNSSHRELQSCESACLAALNLNPTHHKSIYRLSEVMLMLDRPKDALILIEKYSNNSDVSVDETIKGIRRRCLAAVLTIGPISMRGSAGASNTTSCGSSNETSLGNSRSNSTSYGNSSACSSAESDDGFEPSAIEDSVVLEHAKHGQDVQPDWSSTAAQEDRTRVEVRTEAEKVDIITATIGSQAAKHLKALQLRANREKNCNTHAWNGWVAPKEEKEVVKDENEEAKVVGSTDGEVDDLVDSGSEKEDEKEEEEERETENDSIFSKNIDSVTISAITSVTPVRIIEETKKEIKERLIKFPADEISIEGKSEVDSVVTKIRVKGAKKAERLALELEGKTKKVKGRGGEKGGKSKPDKVVKLPTKDVTSHALDHYNSLKSVSVLFTKSFNRASAITKTDVLVKISELDINSVKSPLPNGEVPELVKGNNAVLEDLYDQMDEYVETAIKVSGGL